MPIRSEVEVEDEVVLDVDDIAVLRNGAVKADVN